MERAIALRLKGVTQEETGRVLAQRLIELGKRAEVMDVAMAANLGPSAGFVCRLLVRNGVFVIVVSDEVKPDCECREIELDKNDTADFAAEKILDTLAHENLVSLETHDYSADEEEEIRRRLADLGYIE